MICAFDYLGIKNIKQSTFLLRNVLSLMLIKMRSGRFSFCGVDFNWFFFDCYGSSMN
jgi:hypothetical protein